MSSLPVRLRVTLAFTLAMAALLAALGAFLYFQLRSDLDETIDDNLRSRLGEVSGLVFSRPPAGGGFGFAFGDEDETFAQVLRPDGSVAFSTSAAGDQPLLTSAELPPSGGEPVEIEHDSLPGVEGGARLVAARAGDDERLTVVVGASLDDRDETLASLLTLIFIGGPVALLLASAAGYLAAGGALRPVEKMRTRAADISASEPGERLPVPPVDDELGRLGRTLNEMLDRLEAAIERERRFVDDASHELRTPLALMKTELELALRRTRSQAELEDAIRSAAEETDRLSQLAEDLLVIARSEQGELPLRTEDVAVGQLLDAVAERFASRARDSGRTIVVVPSPPTAVHGDALRLEQALGNVVENALRHGSGPVRLRAEQRNGVVELHATDDGTGFPPEFLPRAFERFSRADEARGRGGTGLGLAIVDVIARAHGGSAQAANRPEGGADVWLALPDGD